MRTEAHWKEVEETVGHQEAHRVAFQIKEYATKEGYDPRGVKVYSKKYAMAKGYGRATSVIEWIEGPDSWAENIEPFVVSDVCILAANKTIVFYDI